MKRTQTSWLCPVPCSIYLTKKGTRTIYLKSWVTGKCGSSVYWNPRGVRNSCWQDKDRHCCQRLTKDFCKVKWWMSYSVCLTGFDYSLAFSSPFLKVALLEDLVFVNVLGIWFKQLYHFSIKFMTRVISCTWIECISFLSSCFKQTNNITTQQWCHHQRQLLVHVLEIYCPFIWEYLTWYISNFKKMSV